VPRRTHERFLLALAIHPAEADDLAALDENGWGRIDPQAVAATPDDYREFIHTSKAEFGIAKSGYVVSHSGWFSDRSACYLASGRPVLAQDTGLSGIVPTGCGFVTFSTEDEAVAGIEAISGDYDAHARGARELAEAYFDSTRVLSRLLNEVSQ
jgi:glycosyltransferase involved in cell wall biosynthesis